MLTREENETLTRVGRGTPAGEMLRRYWMPVASAGELTDEKPIKAVRALGRRTWSCIATKGDATAWSASIARIARRRWPLVELMKRGFVVPITAGNSTARESA